MPRFADENSGTQTVAGSRGMNRSAWQISQPGTVMRWWQMLVITALPPRAPWAARMLWPAVTAVAGCGQAAMVAASRAPHPGNGHPLVAAGEVPGGRRRACCRGGRSRCGAALVSVLYRGSLAQSGHIEDSSGRPSSRRSHRGRPARRSGGPRRITALLADSAKTAEGQR